MKLGVLWALWFAVGLGLLSPGPTQAQLPFGEKQYEYELSDVLPDAQVFDRTETHWRGFRDESRSELVGFVLLTDELVDVPGYSGETMNTLVGIDTEGVITGVKIVRHSEPIVLIGLPEATIHEFTGQYLGKNIRDRILISRTPVEGYTRVDGISGATVTAVAENATILEAGRLVGRAEGVVDAAAVRKRRPSATFEPFSWRELESRSAIGGVSSASDDAAFTGSDRAQTVDLRFAVIDPPAIGRNLLGERNYATVQNRLSEEGGSALYIGGTGDISFKGAGFARGGIFDRFVVEQAGNLFVFTDLDYIAFPALELADAPRFREGGVFFVGPEFDPAESFSFRLTVPYRVADERQYATFVSDYALPTRFIDSETPFWVTRWTSAWPAVVITGLLLVGLLLAFIFRSKMVPHRKWLHRGSAVVVSVVLGIMAAQPSTTQILTFFGSAVDGRFPSEIYLSEPLLFMMWIAIAITLLIWGRGFFCGWVCPYGALLEWLILIWEKIAPASLRKRIDSWRPPNWLRYGKVATFLVILGVSFVNLPFAEALDEVEPFKTFVLRLARPPGFVLYFLVITAVSVVSYRFFCRFLCPLGGALAIPSRIKPFFPLFRYQMCTNCKICAKGCEPQAISFENGRIDYQECLQCWDCQATGTNEKVCPELIVAKKENRPVQIMVGVLLALSLFPDTSSAESRHVLPGEVLQDVISRASPGDTLVLEPGVHSGAVLIDRPLTLSGRPGAVIDGEGSGHVVLVRGTDVTVEGLTLRHCRAEDAYADAGVWIEKDAANARIVGNVIETCRFGIWVHGSAGTELDNNRVVGIKDKVHNSRGDCIHLWDSDGVIVTGNELSACRDGIYMELTSRGRIAGNRIEDSRYAVHTMWCDESHYTDNYATDNLVGMALMFSARIEMKDNILHNNRTHGALLVQVTYAKAEGNTLIGNTKGLFVYNSLYNTIKGNLVARNNLGAHYWGGSEDNVLEENAFIENEIQVKYVAAKDQTWPGNFWSDYQGWDLDDDGRGETPYRSNTLVDAVLWKYPQSKFLLASPAFQALALAEREFPIITVPKAVDPTPSMAPSHSDWAAVLEKYPASPDRYYMEMEKLPHIPGNGSDGR